MQEDINQKIVVKTEDHSSEAVRNITASFRELQSVLQKNFGNLKPNFGFDPGSIGRIKHAQEQAARDLKSRFSFESRMARQREKEQKSAKQAEAKADRDHASAFRERMRLTVALGKQRAREERDVARERAAGLRETIRLDNYRFSLRERHEKEQARSEARDQRERNRFGGKSWRGGRDAIRDGSRRTTAAAALGVGATTLAMNKALGAEQDIDSAEISTRIYGGLSKDAARSLRDQWAAPLAEALGTGADKLLSAWTDALKLGIPNEGAKAFAGLSTQTAVAWELPFENVTDVLGTLNTVMTSKGGAFDFAKLKSVANAIQHLAAKQSTTPERLLEFMKQAAGGAALLGMSLEQAAAFGSASTSLGNRPGESGRILDFIAGRTVELPRLTRKHGDEGRQARDLVRSLGFGSADEMDRQRRADPDAFLPDLMQRFGRISDPRKQDEAIRFFAGREWLGEFGRMVKGLDTYREAVNLAKESKGLDAIGTVWDLYKTKLSFVFKQFAAGWRNILGEFGKELSPLARQAGDFFLAWSAQLRSGGLAARFKATLTGFIEGLGFSDLPALLEGTFGRPGAGDAGSVKAWGDAARGFASGLRDVGQTIKEAVSAFPGADASAETIGRWTGRIIAFLAALVVISPLLGVLASLTTFITGLVGAVGGAGAALGWPLVGATIAAGFTSYLLNQGPASLDKLTGGKQGKALDAAKEAGGWFGLPGFGLSVIDGLLKGIIGQKESQDGLKGSLDENAKVLKQRFEGETGFGSLIRKASFSGSDEIRDLKQMFSAQGARLQLASLGNPGLGSSLGGGGGGSLGGGGVTMVPGGGISTGRGALGRRGIIGGGEGGGSLGGGSAPRGDGSGTRGSARTGRMMAWAMDQLRREGVPEDKLKQATAHLVGQAQMESGLDPNKVHNGGTGYGGRPPQEWSALRYGFRARTRTDRWERSGTSPRRSSPSCGRRTCWSRRARA